MCGIAGYIGTTPPSPEQVEDALRSMRRRGPDSCAHLRLEAGERTALLLHSRLSIIDLNDRANQPFVAEGCSLVFNGEIYNYLELRKELEALGHEFRTSSDTEVLLKAYLQWGGDCVHRLEGMWGFAIFDKRTNTLLLSRDRFGEKPLYTLATGHGLYFGSEIKFIKALLGRSLAPNIPKLIQFMVSGYKTIHKDDSTFFKDAFELPPASTMLLGPGNAPKLNRFWRPTFHPRPMSLDDAISGTRHHLFESLRIRLRADVPLACCLSGGVDSCSIASIATKVFNCDVATFSIIDTDERYDESENIRATVEDLGCRNVSLVLQPNKGIAPLREMVAYHDAPLITISYYIHSLLMREVATLGYRVVFSGTGADELFTGYYDHFLQHLYEMRGHASHEQLKADWIKHIQPVIRNPFLRDPDYYLADPTRREHMLLNSDVFTSCFKEAVAAEFTETHYCDDLLRNRMLNELFHEGTRPILHDDDLNAMFYSIENRSPFLDSRLFDFAYSVPNEHLIRNGYAKYLLREAVAGILNDKVRLDRKKKGFNASIDSIFNLGKGEDRDFILSDSPIYDFISRDKIAEVISQDTFPNSMAKFIFSFINCKLFLEING